jgi:carbonic anhydrase
MELIYRYDPFQPVLVHRPTDCDGAISTLLAGNRRLVTLIEQMQQAAIDGGDNDQARQVIPVDLVSMGLPFVAGAAPDQAPFALVLGCSDARVPVESVFDRSFNDVFVIRIAGNVLGTECIGSFDYAVRQLGGSLQAVVVLGHTSCGAVSAAVNAYLSPDDFADIALTHPLRTLVDRILIAVRGAANGFERACGHEVDRHPGYRAALIEASVYLNAAIAAFDLQREAQTAGTRDIRAFYGVCDIGTMLVSDLPQSVDSTSPQLAPAPPNPQCFVSLTDRIVAAVLEKMDDRPAAVAPQMV